MQAPRTWISAALYSVLSAMVDISMVGLCLHAVNIQLGVINWALFYLMINVVIIIPSTPGQVGVLETSGMMVLGALGIEHSQGLSATIIYHTAHFFPMTLLGLIILQLQSVKK